MNKPFLKSNLSADLQKEIEEAETEIDYIRKLEYVIQTWPTLQKLQIEAPRLHKLLTDAKNKLYDVMNAYEVGKYDEPYKPPMNFDFLLEEHELLKKQNKNTIFCDSDDEYKSD